MTGSIKERTTAVIQHVVISNNKSNQILKQKSDWKRSRITLFQPFALIKLFNSLNITVTNHDVSDL